MEVFRLAGILLSLLSLGLLGLALVSDSWLRSSDMPGSHGGLWKICVSKICTLYPDNVPGFFHTTRFFLVLAMLAGCLASLALGASFFCSHLCSASLSTVSTMSSFGAGLCVMIAMAVFTSGESQKVLPEMFAYSWSYSLGWLSFFLYLGTGAVTLLSRRSSYSQL